MDSIKNFKVKQTSYMYARFSNTVKTYFLGTAFNCFLVIVFIELKLNSSKEWTVANKQIPKIVKK